MHYLLENSLLLLFVPKLFHHYLAELLPLLFEIKVLLQVHYLIILLFYYLLLLKKIYFLIRQSPGGYAKSLANLKKKN